MAAHIAGRRRSAVESVAVARWSASGIPGDGTSVDLTCAMSHHAANPAVRGRVFVIGDLDRHFESLEQESHREAPEHAREHAAGDGDRSRATCGNGPTTASGRKPATARRTRHQTDCGWKPTVASRSEPVTCVGTIGDETQRMPIAFRRRSSKRWRFKIRGVAFLPRYRHDPPHNVTGTPGRGHRKVCS